MREHRKEADIHWCQGWDGIWSSRYPRNHFLYRRLGYEELVEKKIEEQCTENCTAVRTRARSETFDAWRDAAALQRISR